MEECFCIRREKLRFWLQSTDLSMEEILAPGLVAVEKFSENNLWLVQVSDPSLIKKSSSMIFRDGGGVIEPFVKESVISSSEVARIVEYCGKNNHNNHCIVDDGLMRQLSICTVEEGDFVGLYLKLGELLREAGVKIFPNGDAVNWITKVQHCRYQAGDHFETWHCDETEEPTSYKTLAAVVFLSKPKVDYTGGEFQFKSSSSSSEYIRTLATAQYSAVVFDARRDFHRVLKVMGGVRETLVFWATDRDVSLQYEACVDVRTIISSCKTPLKTPKLVIWDLDGTLWEGTLDDDDSETNSSNIRIRQELVDFIKDCAQHGVVSSICSRAHKAAATSLLESLKISELIVFAQFIDDGQGEITSSSKATVLSSMIEAMSLRSQDVLFVNNRVIIHPSTQGCDDIAHNLRKVPRLSLFIVVYFDMMAFMNDGMIGGRQFPQQGGGLSALSRNWR